MSEKLTKCKTCGADMATKAKVCMGCGAKNKKPFYTKWWVWTIAVIVIGMAVSSGSEDTATSTTPSDSKNKTTQSEPEQTYKIGDTVKAVDIEYTVLEVKDVKSIGKNQYLKKETENNFLVVKVTVKNTSEKSKVIDTNMFKLKDDSGATYSADATADMYVNDTGEGFFLKQANPNIVKTGYIVFETPAKNTDKPFDLVVSGGFGSSKNAVIKLIQ